jgi:hypothetical protein
MYSQIFDIKKDAESKVKCGSPCGIRASANFTLDGKKSGSSPAIGTRKMA